MVLKGSKIGLKSVQKSVEDPSSCLILLRSGFCLLFVPFWSDSCIQNEWSVFSKQYEAFEQIWEVAFQKQNNEEGQLVKKRTRLHAAS